MQSIAQGSGLFGSIKSTDLDKASVAISKKTATTGVCGDGFVDKPVTNVRKIIAKRLLESKQVKYHFLLNRQCLTNLFGLLIDYTTLLSYC